MIGIELTAVETNKAGTQVIVQTTVNIDCIVSVSRHKTQGSTFTLVKVKDCEDMLVMEPYNKVLGMIRDAREKPEQPAYVFKVGGLTHYIPVTKVSRYAIAPENNHVTLVMSDGWSVETWLAYSELRKTIINVPL